MRKPIIAGNWKMYKSPEDTRLFFQEFMAQKLPAEVRILFAVPFIDILGALDVTRGSGIEIGAQTLSEYDCGAYTGEIAASMLQEVGVSFALIGHSERRTLFHETDQMIHNKMKKALQSGIIPILCFGETSSERREGKTSEVLERQIYEALQGIGPSDLSKVILAYEPIWAIGTGLTASPQVAQETHQACREFLRKTWGHSFADNVCILYGGSVKSDNIAGLMSQSDIDGALVGGASLKSMEFSQIVNF
ncbi:MAG: triose-phosphate isomerase [Chlamydiae bacterium]|nr:triose-phosphate isomerase [Chlamydiota bacterium]